MKYIVLLLCLLGLSSCAAVYTGSREVIHVDSYPQGANVKLNKKTIGVTPVTAIVRPKLGKQQLSISKPGYETVDQRVKKQFNLLSPFSLYLFPIEVWIGSALSFKEKYYNIDLATNTNHPQKGNFYVVSFGGDTTYVMPRVEHKTKGLIYKTLAGEERSMPWEQLKECRILTVHRKRIGYLLLSCCYDVDFKRRTFVTIEQRARKNKVFYTQLEKVLENGEYRLLIDYYQSTSTSYNASTGSLSTTTVTKPVYLIYRNNEIVAKLKNRNCIENVKKYFDNYPELIKQLNEKPKVKTVLSYSAALQ